MASPGDKRVLIVEDDESMRTLITMTVEGEGFKASAVADGEKAVAAIEKEVPDLIITDLMMPKLGGYELLRALGAAGASGVPVIVATGRQCEPAMVATIKAEGNVVEFFTKPLKMTAFTLALHKHLGTKPAGEAEKGRDLNQRPPGGDYRYDAER